MLLQLNVFPLPPITLVVHENLVQVTSQNICRNHLLETVTSHTFFPQMLLLIYVSSFFYATNVLQECSREFLVVI